MLIDAEPLRKVLALEAKKGYQDTAVMGGLDVFLRRWSEKAMGSLADPKLLKQFNRLKLADAPYGSLDAEKRQEFITRVGNFLDTAEKTALEKPKDKPKVSRSTPCPGRVPAGQSLDAPVTAIKGISSATAARFVRLGVKTVRDLLFFFPSRHIDYSQRKHIAELAEGKEETIIANVWEAQVKFIGRRRSTEATVGDETGNIRVIWFNNPYIAKSLTTNARVVLSGRVRVFNGRPVFESPEWEILGDGELIHTARLVPVYPLTQGLRPRQVRKLVSDTVAQWSGQMEDYLPESLRARCQLLPLPEAIRQAHFPDDATLKDRARTRLAFDELFVLQLGVLRKKREWQEGQPGNPMPAPGPELDRFIGSLPFTLTAAQQKVTSEILGDMARDCPMSRLLQGEVGSGKTVVATAALLTAAANGFQGALMAPTEILAAQHLATVRSLLARAGREESGEENIYYYSGILPRPLSVALLIGDTARAKKQAVQKLLSRGDIDIIIGTHALIQKGFNFHRLGMAVIDEQHRFGVAQRSELRQKGFNPHILVMTATPIPRTLALTIYGDLDLSVIDELPPGRQEIKTKWLKPAQRDSAYEFIRRQVAAGRQAFIICPLVEESEAIQARAATAEFDRLSREVFSELKLGLLHGRMKPAEKEDVMGRFHSGELHILVSTPVVEVGVDVPNATVMMVESADRFGLSQLHQFRGRVGRGREQSYCMLMAEDPSEISRQRLDIIEKVSNGFRLAEEDLKLRGPGEFFGTRQSGVPDLRMARLSDVSLLELARNEARRLFQTDPDLEEPEQQRLAKEVARVWRRAAEVS